MDPTTTSPIINSPSTSQANVQETPQEVSPPAFETKKRIKIPKIPFPKGRGRLILILALILFVLIALAIGLSINGKFGGQREEIISSPTPESEEVGESETEEGELSEYASNPQIQEIGRELEEIEKKIDETRVREEALNIPLLDFEVSF